MNCVYGRKDDAERFLTFCNAALEFLVQTGRSPVSPQGLQFPLCREAPGSPAPSVLRGKRALSGSHVSAGTLSLSSLCAERHTGTLLLFPFLWDGCDHWGVAWPPRGMGL